MQTIRVLALTPPGSMGRVLSDLRGGLYRLWGACSALALPPCLPLLPWPLSLPRSETAALLASCAGPLVAELERIDRVERHLFLMVRGVGLQELRDRLERAIRSAAGPSAAPAASAPFPGGAGFLLAGPDLEAPLEEIERAVPIPPERRFSSYALTLLCIRSHAPAERWWEVVSWEEELVVPVKRNGRAAPGSGARMPRCHGGEPTAAGGAPRPARG